ncbi:receptor homology region, transmembrane domain- and RING domain-containing protein 2 [Selaginella moellendorffii]|uniref:receptor homology region, transmembrane domain- and RING domain-containing protein 2 n=1 Tax=Selaginella moellendorffii TaxID=88036 RepID=UPI000D1C6887|nr:receptor homology region, transmembrane domain- and RING domain-containing protein 2 [Selaginella moellendorffii]|eukprot:XP_002992777.2 receptor homology region, transmembrane domain- and RING domain-containing protein 2 [Selaginella moellendorffii]
MPPPVENAEANSGRFVTLREIMITIAGLLLVVLTLVLGRASAMVVLITAKNETLPFPDMEASFAPRVPASGISGLFYEAYPLNACDAIINGPGLLIGSIPVFAIVERGGCKFDEKILNAQDAGFSAVIVYNNEEGHDLISMSGSSDDVRIPAVFVSKSAGETLLEYSKQIGARCYILPAIENTAWSVMAVSFISLLAVTAVLTTFLFVRRYRLRHLGSRLLLLRDSYGMSAREVKALPTVIFKCLGDGQGTSDTCAICLEDYESGEKLRVLPCHHDFHAACVDQWLTTRRPFCPVCKRDAHNKNEEPPPSESTPLLAATAVSPPATTQPAATQTSPVGDGACDDESARGASSLRETPVGSPSPTEESSSPGRAFGFHSAPDTFLQIDDDSSAAAITDTTTTTASSSDHHRHNHSRCYSDINSSSSSSVERLC